MTRVKPIDAPETPHGSWLAPRDGGRRKHAGIDIGGREGAVVRSPVAGVVVESREEGKRGSGFKGYAPAVMVRDDEGRFHLLAHLKPGSLVPVGSVVEAGDPVGKVGKEKHVHWEIRQGKQFPAYSKGELPWNISVSPLAWLEGRIVRPFDEGAPPPQSAPVAAKTTTTTTRKAGGLAWMLLLLLLATRSQRS